MNEPSEKIACLADWALLPFRREWQRGDSAMSLECGESPRDMRRQLERLSYRMACCSPACLLRHLPFELAVPQGLSVNGASGICYIGFDESQLSIKASLEARLTSMYEISRSLLQDFGENITAHASTLVQRLRRQSAEMLPWVGPLPISTHTDSSTQLVRFLAWLVFGEDEFRNQEIRQNARNSGTLPVVLEGNEALVRRKQFVGIIDLGDVWQKLTGLPFVLQVWQRHSKHPCGQKASKIVKVAELAEARMKVEPSSYFPDILPSDQQGGEIDLAKLWRNVHYRLGAPEIKSILLFLHFMMSMGQPQETADALTAKMIRWQERDRSII